MTGAATRASQRGNHGIDTSARFGAALSLLHPLAQILDARADDVVEVNVATDGKAGAMVFAQTMPSPACLRAALQLSELAADRLEFLLDLAARIPSAQCAVRLLVDGGASLFWPIDIDAAAVETLCDALGQPDEGMRLHGLFAALTGSACGFACELLASGPPRIRFYHMCPASIAGREALLAALTRELEFSPVLADQVRRAWQLVRPREHVVTNLALSHGTGPQLKLEFPGLSAAATARLLHTPSEHAWLRSLAAHPRARFTHVGIRWHEHGPTELTAYIDAHRLLDATNPEAA